MRRNSKALTVLVTAGPTRAYLDRVRYISNYSSGHLGYEICRELERRGNKVVAVVGPCEAPFHKLKKTKVIEAITVGQMHDAVMKVCKHTKPHFAVLAAAVLDFEPKKVESGKVSSKKNWKLDLVPTPKIIDEISLRFPQIKKIAFKLEWKSPALYKLRQFAYKNMSDKSAEALCLNYLSEIDHKSHPAFFFSKKGEIKKLGSKREIAKEIGRFISTSDSTQEKS